MTKIILAIESSCDETAVAIVDDSRKIWAHCLKSQIELHAPYGGVVPEIAARSHVDVLDYLVSQALKESGLLLNDIDAFAATAGPGLSGGLLIATTAAKTLAMSQNKPFIAVNHLEGHILTPTLFHQNLQEFLVLLVSGGHCLLAYMPEMHTYHVLGQTLDDAVGEAFDKTARLLAFGYPGGPFIEAAALKGDPSKFALPPVMTRQQNCNFSFSGLKTAVARAVETNKNDLSIEEKNNIAAAFQARVIEQLLSRTERAIKQTHAKNFTIVGGVAANTAIRNAFEELTKTHGTCMYLPPTNLCTDNAVMIAWTAVQLFIKGVEHPLDFPIFPRWPLSAISSEAKT